MKITITSIALSVLFSGVAFSQEIERPCLAERLEERGTSEKQAVVKIGLVKRDWKEKASVDQREFSNQNLRHHAQKDALKDLQQTLQAEINEKGMNSRGCNS